VSAHYGRATGDWNVLNEDLGFLDGPALAPDQHEQFFAAPRSANSASLFEHCARALDSSLSMGQHGLPLFGGGDWNDGMNRVGAAGRGESVWLAWFLHTVLLQFVPIAERRDEMARASRWKDHAFRLQQSIEREAWDGDWYRRGYYDDGTALGSFASPECRIDSIAQSWGVISGGAEPARAARAMSSVDAQLVSRSEALIRLFTPPFDHTPQDPGYIKGYPPGIRENGGQYTHAAIWTVLAFAKLGDGDRAAELFALINPINHSSTRAGIYRYKVEPYVASADVYTAPAHVGRGGWTWYTGSAGWMYRTALEGILGFEVRGDQLIINPCIPRAWTTYSIAYRHRSTLYQIRIDNPDHVNQRIRSAAMDGVELARGCATFALVDDGATHAVTVVLG
jgi:cyclic beta-1,2-glucan synthetase